MEERDLTWRSLPGGGFLLRHGIVTGSSRSRTFRPVADRGCGPGGRRQQHPMEFCGSTSRRCTPPRHPRLRDASLAPQRAFDGSTPPAGSGRGGSSALLVPTGHRGDGSLPALSPFGSVAGSAGADLDAPASRSSGVCSPSAGGGEHDAALGGGKWREAAALGNTMRRWVEENGDRRQRWGTRCGVGWRKMARGGGVGEHDAAAALCLGYREDSMRGGACSFLLGFVFSCWIWTIHRSV
jgi:hypothetical protein